LLAVLLSYSADSSRLQHILDEDWVRAWDGWLDCTIALQYADDDASQEEICHEFVQRFSRIVLSNIDIRGKTDRERREELSRAGQRLGQGLVYSSNACLIDSLLQLLAAHGFLSTSLLSDRASRQNACIACRSFLVVHVDERLHPRLRLSNGEIADVADIEHERSFLQHDIHGEAIIRFLLDYFNSTQTIEPREFA
jgi:hypothetical protein